LLTLALVGFEPGPSVSEAKTLTTATQRQAKRVLRHQLPREFSKALLGSMLQFLIRELINNFKKYFRRNN
jgi:hypothetical protein